MLRLCTATQALHSTQVRTAEPTMLRRLLTVCRLVRSPNLDYGLCARTYLMQLQCAVSTHCVDRCGWMRARSCAPTA